MKPSVGARSNVPGDKIMADFCRECSLGLFGEDFQEMCNLTSWQAFEEGRAASVLCEDCGPIQVAPHGNCLTEDCLKAHSESHHGELRVYKGANHPFFEERNAWGGTHWASTWPAGTAIRGAGRRTTVSAQPEVRAPRSRRPASPPPLPSPCPSPPVPW